MGALDQAEANRLLNASLGLAAYTAPTTPMMLRLYSVTGSAAAAGTQVVGGSYTPQSLTAALPAGGTNGAITTTGAVSFTGMPAITTTAVEVYDSNGTPRRAWWGALSASKATGAGDTLTFAAGAISLNINP